GSVKNRIRDSQLTIEGLRCYKPREIERQQLPCRCRTREGPHRSCWHELRGGERFPRLIDRQHRVESFGLVGADRTQAHFQISHEAAECLLSAAGGLSKIGT